MYSVAGLIVLVTEMVCNKEQRANMASAWNQNKHQLLHTLALEQTIIN
jgi:hypothetical protein